MTKKEYCTTHESVAYYSGSNGLEIKGIEYGIDDYIYSVSGCWYGHPEYHKNRIMYDSKGNPFIRIHGYRIPLGECIRINTCWGGEWNE